MNKKLLCIISLFAILSITNQVFPYIVESNHIQDILNYVEEDTLVIFDIDNTIGKLDRVIGSDVWFYHTFNNMIQSGKSDDQTIEELLPLTTKIHEHSWLVPLEPCISILIQSLQAKTKVIALTSRSITILPRTLEQLNHIGIDFHNSSLIDQEFDFTFNKHDVYKTVAHKDGVIFCGKNNKGDVLMHIFIHLQYYPKKVIFIDDKKKYLEAVEQAMDRIGIDFVGIRYGACDQHVADFDPVEAEKELKHFYATLSA